MRPETVEELTRMRDSAENAARDAERAVDDCRQRMRHHEVAARIAREQVADYDEMLGRRR